MNPKKHSDNVQELIDRLNNKNDPYEALGLHQTASQSEIHDRNKYLRKLVHPDKNGGSEKATKAFQRLQIFCTELQNRRFKKKESEEARKEERRKQEEKKQYEDMNQNNFPNEDDKKDDSFDYEQEARKSEQFQQWKRKFDQQTLLEHYLPLRSCQANQFSCVNVTMRKVKRV